MKKIDVSLKFPCFLYNPANVGNLTFGSSSFSKPSLDIWIFLVHIMLKSSMQDFKHDLSSMGYECNCPMISTLFSCFVMMLNRKDRRENVYIYWNKDLGTSKNSRKTSISALLTMPKPLTVWITINCGKFWDRWEYQTTWSASWEICMQIRKQQLELDMEQQTGSK